MPTHTCLTCGQPFEAVTARRRYCGGSCFRAHEAAESRRRWATWSAERRTAYIRVSNAIYSGKLIRQPCEVCGARNDIDAHHDDYSKPLDVRWLCRSHHRLHHVSLARAEAAP